MCNYNMDDISELIDKSFYGAGSERIYAKIIDEIQRAVIIKALERSFGNRVQASKILGMHRNTLSGKIKKFNIDVGGFKR
ncbi:MAG: helix-turn-helix domain-containing protein [Candidatus Omnitrophota bacterium]